MNTIENLSTFDGWDAFERECQCEVRTYPEPQPGGTIALSLGTTGIARPQKPVAACCAACGRPLAETGGRRIARFRSGVAVRDDSLWLRGTCWSLGAVKRALAQARNQEIPWLCQFCANTFHCDECHWPLWYPGGAEVLADDGKESHCGLLPVGNLGCINPQCPNSHEGIVKRRSRG